MIFTCRDYRFEFPGPPLIMGILNVTPDSFSDGGRYMETGRAVDRTLELVAQGAGIIDIGGESTRPYAKPVSVSEEIKRVLPVLERVIGQVQVPISIDTTKVEVARVALEAGVSIVNDISANREGPQLWETVARFGAGYVLMHMKGQPRTMQDEPCYDDVTSEVDAFFKERLDRVSQHGIVTDQTLIDVGIGFGKTPIHNVELMVKMDNFHQFNRPLLLGASRKSFISKVTGSDGENRLGGSLASVLWAMEKGVQVFRVHDVEETRQAVLLWERLKSESKGRS